MFCPNDLALIPGAINGNFVIKSHGEAVQLGPGDSRVCGGNAACVELVARQKQIADGSLRHERNVVPSSELFHGDCISITVCVLVLRSCDHLSVRPWKT